MVGVAIFNRGISMLLFRPSKSEAVYSEIYINECLEKRLLPFIDHPDSINIFWSDLAIILNRQWLGWMKMSNLCPNH